MKYIFLSVIILILPSFASACDYSSAFDQSPTIIGQSSLRLDSGQRNQGIISDYDGDNINDLMIVESERGSPSALSVELTILSGYTGDILLATSYSVTDLNRPALEALFTAPVGIEKVVPISDRDGDGRTDLRVIAHEYVLTLSSAGTVLDILSILSRYGSVGNPRFIGDLTGDGVSDIVAAFYHMDSTGSPVPSVVDGSSLDQILDPLDLFRSNEDVHYIRDEFPIGDISKDGVDDVAFAHKICLRWVVEVPLCLEYNFIIEGLDTREGRGRLAFALTESLFQDPIQQEDRIYIQKAPDHNRDGIEDLVFRYERMVQSADGEPTSENVVRIISGDTKSFSEITGGGPQVFSSFVTDSESSWVFDESLQIVNLDYDMDGIRDFVLTKSNESDSQRYIVSGLDGTILSTISGEMELAPFYADDYFSSGFYQITTDLISVAGGSAGGGVGVCTQSPPSEIGNNLTQFELEATLSDGFSEIYEKFSYAKRRLPRRPNVDGLSRVRKKRRLRAWRERRGKIVGARSDTDRILSEMIDALQEGEAQSIASASYPAANATSLSLLKRQFNRLKRAKRKRKRRQRVFLSSLDSVATRN